MRKRSHARARRTLPIGAVRKLLAEWQARLGLQGYVIDVQFARASAFKELGTLGQCDALRMKRKAWIQLLAAADYTEDTALDDHETILVHELLHLVFPSRLYGLKLDEDDVRYQLYEQAIDQLARTLVALKRGSA